MLFSTFASVFAQEHPTGSIDRIGRRIVVRFSVPGKPYAYAGSVHSVAERLGLIPTIDYVADARAVAQRLSDGETDVVAAYGLSDNLRLIHSLPIAHVRTGLDEYDRPLSVYNLTDENDPWSS